jgi:DNA polymerase-3 subunit epsilon
MDTADGAGALSVRDVVGRHDGELWIERDRDGGPPAFCFLLPLAASEPAPALTPGLARPEYYDFDLFAVGEGDRTLDERLLSELAYTVIDTETTGLNPAEGDEIIQIGATRIVNGRLLRGECFDELVDPRRSIPEASVRIHGIRPEHVRGKPTIADVLPALRAFIGDTVLVGHNVAFDMSFLRRKEEVSGALFELPVLDTLLLSTVVHPNETAHGLDAIGRRLGVATSGRHTALGDAISTAELFLKLLPLLRQRGIQTLSQAREAARNSYYARLRY